MIGFPPEETGERFRNVELDSGDYLATDETDTMLLGHKLADKYDLQVGDVANFRGVDFMVKGVFKPYEGFFINDSAVVPLEAVRAIALLRPESVALQVIPVEGADIEELARTIDAKIDGVSVVSPKKAEEQARRNLIIGIIVTVILGAVAGSFRRCAPRDWIR